MRRRSNCTEPERYDYHYDRRERLSMPGAPQKEARGRGLFRNNRGLMILLIDIVVIVIVAVIYRQFLYEPPYRGELAGYHLLLRGFTLQDRVMVDLQVEARASTTPRDDRVYAVFTAEGAEIRLSGPLPRGDDPLSLNGAILSSQVADRVQAVVTIAGKTVRLTRRLDSD